MFSSLVAVDSAVVLAVGGSALYFHSSQLPRPPLGVLNLTDVIILIGIIVAMPYLYLALPIAVMSVVIGGGLLSTLLLGSHPILRPSIARVAVIALLVGDVLAVASGGRYLPYALNDLIALLTVIAVANIWVQSGLSARDATILAGCLAVYDPIATTFLSLTGQLFSRYAHAPFAPLVAWPTHSTNWLGVGVGDVLIASLLPLVMTKAYGSASGRITGFLVVLVITLVSLVGLLSSSPQILPLMSLVGPVAVVNYIIWQRRYPRERTTAEYRSGVPMSEMLESSRTSSRDDASEPEGGDQPSFVRPSAM